MINFLKSKNEYFEMQKSDMKAAMIGHKIFFSNSNKIIKIKLNERPIL